MERLITFVLVLLITTQGQNPLITIEWINTITITVS